MNKKKCQNKEKWVPPKWVSVFQYSGIVIFAIGIILHLINFWTSKWLLGIIFVGGVLFAIGAEGKIPPDIPGVWEDDY